MTDSIGSESGIVDLVYGLDKIINLSIFFRYIKNLYMFRKIVEKQKL